MPNVVTGNIIQFRVWCLDSEQASVNTFNFTAGTLVGGPITVQNCVDAFNALIAPLYKPILTSVATYRGVQGRVINRLPLETEDFTIASSGAGTGSATPNPRQVAGITTWVTGFAGPGHRGRTYWPFTPADADSAPGEPSGAYKTNAGTLSLAITSFASVTSGGSSIALQHGLKVKAGPLLIPISGYTVQPKWATQQRRGSYGRANTSPI